MLGGGFVSCFLGGGVGGRWGEGSGGGGEVVVVVVGWGVRRRWGVGRGWGGGEEVGWGDT